MTDHLEQTGRDDGRRASALFHGVTTDFAPDVDRLVQGGVARGRTLRRRRRVGTSLAAAAVVAILGAAAGVGSQLAGGDAGPSPDRIADSPAPDRSDPPAPTEPQPTEPQPTDRQPIDASIAVAAADVPGLIGGLVPAVSVDETVRNRSTSFTDLPQEKNVEFFVDGTLTSFGIGRASELATCAELVDPADQPDGLPRGECVVQDGVLLLVWGPETADGVTSLGVWAFVHGYVVSAGSTNAEEGKDVTPVTDAPPLSQEQLTAIVTSDVWFEE